MIKTDGFLPEVKPAPKVVPVGPAKRVRATAKGYHLGPREPGDEFDVPASMKGSWFYELIEKPAAAEAEGTVLSDADLA